MIIEYQFNFGDYLYLKTDPDQKRRMVITVLANCSGGVQYQCVCGTETTWHHFAELSLEKDQLIALNSDKKPKI